MGAAVQLRIRDPQLRRAVELNLRAAWVDAIVANDRVPDVIIATVRDITSTACGWLARHGITVVVLSAVPTRVEEAHYLDAGAVYLPMLLRGGATLGECLATLPEFAPAEGLVNWGTQPG